MGRAYYHYTTTMVCRMSCDGMSHVLWWYVACLVVVYSIYLVVKLAVLTDKRTANTMVIDVYFHHNSTFSCF